MSTGHKTGKARGVVVSDLHFFARRSRAGDCFDSVRTSLASAQVLVLNGDIFDFRWSTLADVDSTLDAAIRWLRDLARDFPECEVHYVIGNHDCLTRFRERLDASRPALPRLQCHEQGLRLGDRLFLHGDCAHRWMDPTGLRHYREQWNNDRQHGRLTTTAYLAADRLRLTHAAHAGWFPRRDTVKRLAHYLDQAWPDWRRATRHCYFGHTHLPFSDYRHDGVVFHNTGSAIRGMGFNPIVFEVHTERAETVM